MRPEGDDVLQDELVVGGRPGTDRCCTAQPQATELTVGPVHHGAVMAWIMSQRIQAAPGQRHVRIIRRQPSHTQADPPARHELIDPPQIPAALVAGIIGRYSPTGGEAARLAAPEQFALELEVVPGRIDVRGPCPYRIGDPQMAVPDKTIRGTLVTRFAVTRLGGQVGEPDLPATAIAPVTTDMSEGRAGTDTVVASSPRRINGPRSTDRLRCSTIWSVGATQHNSTPSSL